MTTQAVGRLVTSVLATRPLVTALGGSVRVVRVGRGEAGGPDAGTSSSDDVARLLGHVAASAGVSLSLEREVAPEDLLVFERVVSDRLALADLAGSLGSLPADLRELDRIVAETTAAGFDGVFRKDGVRSHDGLALNVYSGGPADGETVVLVPACGMPAALAEAWMRFLAHDFRVLSWESRGLFDPSDPVDDFAVDTGAQAADLFTVMDRYGASSAHVVGLCGGAVIGLAAAAREPARIASLSLWHGAYEFGSGSPRTTFQNDLIELMTIAATSRSAARSIQDVFWKVALSNAPTEVAHLVLYPYASADLFYRYCRLNGALARTDVEQYLGRVEQPTLVVTSEDDDTAHPEGSRQLAMALPRATLRVEAHGDHASLFHADNTGLMRAAADFITCHLA